jgi:hypothetical protein
VYVTGIAIDSKGMIYREHGRREISARHRRRLRLVATLVIDRGWSAPTGSRGHQDILWANANQEYPRRSAKTAR